MATLGVTNPTLLDVVNAMDPDGSIATVAEILNETNEILDDWTMIEANGVTGHKTTVRTGIPLPTWRTMYGFVQPTKSTRIQITDSIGMLEAYAEVDKALADLNGNTNEFRLSEDRAHIEGMSQTAAETLFEGDEGLTPEKFTGLNARFNDLSAETADNIIDAGGTGSDNASIWLIGWGPNTVHGIYPKGSTAGLEMQDLGEVTVTDTVGSTGGLFQGYRSHYRWDMGLTVRDWRYIVRICNIDRSLLTPDAASGANLPELMFQAQEEVPSLAGGRFAWYMDKGIRTKVRQQVAAGTSSSTLMWEDVGGKKVMKIDEIPMRRVDTLKTDEARVV